MLPKLTDFLLRFTSRGRSDIPDFSYLYQKWGINSELLIPFQYTTHHLPHISDTMHEGGHSSRLPPEKLHFTFDFGFLSGWKICMFIVPRNTQSYTMLHPLAVGSYFMLHFVSCFSVTVISSRCVYFMLGQQEALWFSPAMIYHHHASCCLLQNIDHFYLLKYVYQTHPLILSPKWREGYWWFITRFNAVSWLLKIKLPPEGSLVFNVFIRSFSVIGPKNHRTSWKKFSYKEENEWNYSVLLCQLFFF